MGLRRVKNVLSSFVKGNYQFGRTFTSRFSDSRWSGVVDALAGVGITAMSVQWLVGNVVTAGVAAMSIASAPITAPITIATSAVFAVLSGMMVGFGVGFLGAALVKSGLPRPSTMVRQVKAAVVDGTAAG
ncbi:MAG: hypothetical protein HY052_05635, partial [Proteobacteria bacterium]|nr:hypothetical protein [Pseudomonadota bacterium]